MFSVNETTNESVVSYILIKLLLNYYITGKYWRSSSASGSLIKKEIFPKKSMGREIRVFCLQKCRPYKYTGLKNAVLWRLVNAQLFCNLKLKQLLHSQIVFLIFKLLFLNSTVLELFIIVYFLSVYFSFMYMVPIWID